jgi:hypothetical protein
MLPEFKVKALLLILDPLLLAVARLLAIHTWAFM